MKEVKETKGTKETKEKGVSKDNKSVSLFANVKDWANRKPGTMILIETGVILALFIVLVVVGCITSGRFSFTDGVNSKTLDAKKDSIVTIEGYLYEVTSETEGVESAWYLVCKPYHDPESFISERMIDGAVRLDNADWFKDGMPCKIRGRLVESKTETSSGMTLKYKLVNCEQEKISKKFADYCDTYIHLYEAGVYNSMNDINAQALAVYNAVYQNDANGIVKIDLTALDNAINEALKYDESVANALREVKSSLEDVNTSIDTGDNEAVSTKLYQGYTSSVSKVVETLDGYDLRDMK